jgi:hypothetical protein
MGWTKQYQLDANDPGGKKKKKKEKKIGEYTLASKLLSHFSFMLLNFKM